jgi:hypothetical protein
MQWCIAAPSRYSSALFSIGRKSKSPTFAAGYHGGGNVASGPSIAAATASCHSALSAVTVLSDIDGANGRTTNSRPAGGGARYPGRAGGGLPALTQSAMSLMKEPTSSSLRPGSSETCLAVHTPKSASTAWNATFTRRSQMRCRSVVSGRKLRSSGCWQKTSVAKCAMPGLMCRSVIGMFITAATSPQPRAALNQTHCSALAIGNFNPLGVPIV